MAKARERVWLSLLRVCRVVYDVAIDTIGGLLEVFLEGFGLDLLFGGTLYEVDDATKEDKEQRCGDKDFGLIVVLAHSRTVDGVSVGLLGLLLDEAIAEA